MKRKALITSTALLLVALICLATASYAWFTSGNANTVAEFNVKVSKGDGDIQLAAADIANTYENTGWKSGLSLADFNGVGFLPEAYGENTKYELTPVSTDGVLADDMFVAAPYDGSAYWNSEEGTFASGNGYLVLSFYAKTAVAGTAPLNITITGADAKFNNAVKLGYAEGENKDFTVYSLDNAGDSYLPVIDKDSKIEKNSDGEFVLKSGSDLGSSITPAQFTSPKTVTFEADTPVLITVALWLEGQDKQCSGTIDVASVNFDIAFGAFTPAA